MGQPVLTPRFNVAFPALHKPVAFQNLDGTQGTPRYSVCAIWHVGDFTTAEKAQWRDVRKALDDAAKEQFGKTYKQLPGNYKKPLRDGAEKEELPEFEGSIFATLSANVDYPPSYVDRQGRNVPAEKIRETFARGAVCRAFVNPYGFDVGVNKGIGMGLVGIQLIEASEHPGGKSPAFPDDLGEAPPDDNGGEGLDGFDDDIPF